MSDDVDNATSSPALAGVRSVAPGFEPGDFEGRAICEPVLTGERKLSIAR